MEQTDSVLTAMLICAINSLFELEISKVSNVTKWLIFRNPVTSQLQCGNHPATLCPATL